VVIGGGDTAMDCVRTAIRQGANSVKCLYRRDKENMPGSLREVKNAEEEGVEFIWLSAPKAFVGREKIEKIIAIKMRMSTKDNVGRCIPVKIENSEFEINADMVIEALGFEAEDLPTIFNEADLKINKSGTISINPQNFMTNIDGIFAAGDIVRGASLVVWAIKDGRDAAVKIDDWINNKHSYIKDAAGT
jgi:glutamate synthase (NADPH) small chain